LGTHYGLGVDVNSQGGHRALSHGGEVSGFTAQNIVFPDDRAAVVVLTNQDAASASGAIAGGIAPLLFATTDPATPAKLEQASKIFDGLQHGTIDRSLFTDNCNAYFSEQASQGLRGGMTLRVYIIRFPQKVLRAWTYEMPDGKLEQYQIAAQN
jgi:D-alanyl-D-alanine carboxypeptidase